VSGAKKRTKNPSRKARETGNEQTGNAESGNAAALNRLIVLAVIGLAFVVLLGVKLSPQPASAPTEEVVSPSSSREDPVQAYEAALKKGRPAYVLFHSTTCQPCIEISSVVDDVIGEYEGRVTFVNCITDDPAAVELARKFSFQYIPTSFFLDSKGRVVDSFTGVLGPEELRARLDKLVS